MKFYLSIRLMVFVITSMLIGTLNAQIDLIADIEGLEFEDRFGYSTTLSNDGNILAIGSPSEVSFNQRPGRVRIYKDSLGTWTQLGMDILGDTIGSQGSGDDFGFSLSLSLNGNRIAIGARQNNINGWNSGRVQVFDRIDSDWIQVGQTINGISANYLLGNKISMSEDGRRMAISGRIAGGIGEEDMGYVKVFELVGVEWVQIGSDIRSISPGSRFGHSLDLSHDGTRLIIGGFDHSNIMPGHAVIFQFQDNEWHQMQDGLIIGASGDNLGKSVAMSGNGKRVIIGAPHWSSGDETAYALILEEINGRWNLIDSIAGESTLSFDREIDDFGSSVAISSNGKIVVIGRSYVTDEYGLVLSSYISLYSEQNGIWNRAGVKIGEEYNYSLFGQYLSISGDGTRFSVGYPDESNFRRNDNVILYDLKGVICNAFIDYSLDCIQENDEPGLSGLIAEILPGNIIVQTDENGLWGLDSLPIGDYSITYDTSSGLWTTNCQVVQYFSIVNPDGITFLSPFGLTSTDPCDKPLVSIQMPRARPCFENQRIYVEAFNGYYATGAINDAYLTLTIDSLLTYQSASSVPTNPSPNIYRFEIGNLNPGQQANVWIDVMVSCDAVSGQSLCLKAEISPVSDCFFETLINPWSSEAECTLPYDYSDLEVYGYCQDDSVHFVIGNMGDGDMACYAPIRFYRDADLTQTDSVLLLAGASRRFDLEADGHTWRIEVDQHPDQLGLSRPNATVERCGDLDNWTRGLVNTMYQDDASPVVDIFCTEVTGSYDPNDKTGYPTGITDDHLVLPKYQL